MSEHSVTGKSQFPTYCSSGPSLPFSCGYSTSSGTDCDDMSYSSVTKASEEGTVWAPYVSTKGGEKDLSKKYCEADGGNQMISTVESHDPPYVAKPFTNDSYQPFASAHPVSETFAHGKPALFGFANGRAAEPLAEGVPAEPLCCPAEESACLVTVGPDDVGFCSVEKAEKPFIEEGITQEGFVTTEKSSEQYAIGEELKDWCFVSSTKDAEPLCTTTTGEPLITPLYSVVSEEDPKKGENIKKGKQEVPSGRIVTETSTVLPERTSDVQTRRSENGPEKEESAGEGEDRGASTATVSMARESASVVDAEPGGEGGAEQGAFGEADEEKVERHEGKVEVLAVKATSTPARTEEPVEPDPEKPKVDKEPAVKAEEVAAVFFLAPPAEEPTQEKEADSPVEIPTEPAATKPAEQPPKTDSPFRTVVRRNEMLNVTVGVPVTSKDHTEYPLEVETTLFELSPYTQSEEGGATPVFSYVVNKRFSDFLQLHEAVLEIVSDPKLFPTHPPKRIWGRFSEETVAERRSAFQKIIDAVLQDSVLRTSFLFLDFVKPAHQQQKK